MAFKNVPPALEAHVRDVVPKLVGNMSNRGREVLYLASAFSVIRHYVSRDVWGDRVDPFVRADRMNGYITYRYPLRIIDIGKTLFSLRSSPGFPEFCRRLKQRDLRSSYFEMYSAFIFFRAGFEIDAKPETQVRGLDFDFVATRGSERINVEVTALQEKEFKNVTIQNALGQKRSQLPSSDPAIICMVLPEQWDGLFDWAEYLRKVTDAFFVGTRRINAVMYMIEKHIDAYQSVGGAYVLITRTGVNERARFPVGDASFLFYNKSVSSYLTRVMNGRIALKTDLVNPTDLMDGEFFRWVDHLIPEKK